MNPPRILIVDDHVEVRRVIRAGLEALESKVEIVDVPSGEEALLIAATKSIDLLISDVRLAGMTGLELQQKIQRRNPGLNVIMITGMTDPALREEAEAAGAVAFFLKPIDLPGLLEAVQTTLNLPETRRPSPESEVTLSDKLAEHLKGLRQELQTIAVVLWDESARLLVKVGDLPEDIVDYNLMAALMASLKTSANITEYLGTSIPEGMMVFPGESYTLILTHVGPSYALLMVGDQSMQLGDAPKVLSTFRQSVYELVGLRTVEKGMQLEALKTGNEAEPADLEGLFNPEIKSSLFRQDVDAFWDALAVEKLDESLVDSDAISYDEAYRLGLISNMDDNSGNEGD
jgi:CheY-like chemotaxis protein